MLTSQTDCKKNLGDPLDEMNAQTTNVFFNKILMFLTLTLVSTTVFNFASWKYILLGGNEREREIKNIKNTYKYL